MKICCYVPLLYVFLLVDELNLNIYLYKLVLKAVSFFTLENAVGYVHKKYKPRVPKRF